MSGSAKVYELTQMRLSVILTRKQQFLKGRMRGGKIDDYGTLEGRIECRECRTPIKLGQQIVSKMFGKRSRIYYHDSCAKQLNII